MKARFESSATLPPELIKHFFIFTKFLQLLLALFALKSGQEVDLVFI
jgi:hypothetical protein